MGLILYTFYNEALKSRIECVLNVCYAISKSIERECCAKSAREREREIGRQRERYKTGLGKLKICAQI